jgi:hypothetical protein
MTKAADPAPFGARAAGGERTDRIRDVCGHVGSSAVASLDMTPLIWGVSGGRNETYRYPEKTANMRDSRSQGGRI